MAKTVSTKEPRRFREPNPARYAGVKTKTRCKFSDDCYPEIAASGRLYRARADAQKARDSARRLEMEVIMQSQADDRYAYDMWSLHAKNRASGHTAWPPYPTRAQERSAGSVWRYWQLNRHKPRPT